MSIFASLDLPHQSSPGFREISYATADKSFPPLMLSVRRASRSFSSSDAHEYADIPAGPFIHRGFFQNLRTWVVLSSAIIVKNALSDLNRLECKAGGTGGTSGLPDRGARFERWLFARVIRAEQDRRAVLGRILEHSCDRTVCSRSVSVKASARLNLRLGAILSSIIHGCIGVAPRRSQTRHYHRLSRAGRT